MAKKVQTGCRDCKKCTNSGFANAGRKTGRASAAVMTAGLSELGFAARKKCRICGHQLSLHKGADAPTPQPAVSVVPPARSRPAPAQLSDELTKLAGLHASGALTDAEFQTAKDRLLGR